MVDDRLIHIFDLKKIHLNPPSPGLEAGPVVTLADLAGMWPGRIPRCRVALGGVKVLPEGQDRSADRFAADPSIDALAAEGGVHGGGGMEPATEGAATQGRVFDRLMRITAVHAEIRAGERAVRKWLIFLVRTPFLAPPMPKSSLCTILLRSIRSTSCAPLVRREGDGT